MEDKSQVNIKDITPTTFGTGFIRGVVSLRWPYSSSQHALSIQLSEEDIRKRSDKGQVRLTFYGAAADVLKDLPSLGTLEVSASSGSAHFEEYNGTAKDANYRISFTGDVYIKQSNGETLALDSRKVIETATPGRTRRTWLSPNLKRTAPSDELGLDEAWFSQPSPGSKRSRYSSGFRFLDSATPTTPSQSPANQALYKENIIPSQTSTTTTKSQHIPESSLSKSSGPEAPTSQRFAFQTPVAPARFETNLSSQPGKRSYDAATDPSTASDLPFSQHIAQTQLIENPQSNRPAADGQEESSADELPSRTSSIQGDPAFSNYDHGTPRSGPQVHFSANHGSAPPTPRNVPYMSLESAHEQEDFYRKLRASAPPKSDAGSSMVADDDDEAGDLAKDPNPTILETQSRVQEGILRSKIMDEAEDQKMRLSLESPGDEQGQSVSTRNEFAVGRHTHDIPDDSGNVTLARSTIAAYGNSSDGNDPTITADARHHSPDQPRSRHKSPSMSERGAAVQESVFRSKIRSSEDGSIGDDQRAESVKSSVFVEPAAASVDGSIHENVERTMLDQQASVQETLFRQKLDRHDAAYHDRAGNLSLVGQAHAASSNVGDEVVNQEPSMLQQQNTVQENIFRDKVDNNSQTAGNHTGPASLDHMEVNDTANVTQLVQDQPLGIDQSSSYAQEPNNEVMLTTAASPVHVTGSIRAIEEFHLKADTENAIGAAVGDEEAEHEARDFLQMEMEAEPEERLALNAADDIEGLGELPYFDPSQQKQQESELRPDAVETSEPVSMVTDQHEAFLVNKTPTDQELFPDQLVNESEQETVDSKNAQEAIDSLGLRVEHDSNPSFDIENVDALDNQFNGRSTASEDNLEVDEKFATENEQRQEGFSGSADSARRHIQKPVSQLIASQDIIYDPVNDYQNSEEGRNSIHNESASLDPDAAYSNLSENHTHVHSVDDPDDSLIDDALGQTVARSDVSNLSTPHAERILETIEITSSRNSVSSQEDDLEDYILEGGQLMLEVESESEHSEGQDLNNRELSDQDCPSSEADSEDDQGQSDQNEIEEEPLVSSTEALETSRSKGDAANKLQITSEDGSHDYPKDDLVTELGHHEAIASMKYGRTMDVIAVCYNVEFSKTKGPDMVWSATLLQPSGARCRVKIFRPRKQSLPVADDGCVLLLRNFRTMSFVRELYLRSQEDSSWAIFSRSEDMVYPSAAMPAAPVEISDKEVQHASSLLLWWSQTGYKLARSVAITKPKLALNQIYENTCFDVEAEVVTIPRFLTSPFTIYLTDYTTYNSDRMKAIPSLDTLSTLGLDGELSQCLVLAIELRSQDARYALERIRAGDKVICQNVLARSGLDGGLYGIIEPDLSGRVRVSLQ